MHFIKGKESKFVLELVGSGLKKNKGQTIMDLEMMELFGNWTLRRDFCVWSGLTKCRINLTE